MRVPIRFLLAAAFLLTCTALVPAQGLEVTPRTQTTPAATDSFTSLEGRFSIALPAQASSFGPEVSLGNDSRRFSFGWHTAHGVFNVTFFDRPQNLEEASKQVLDVFRDGIVTGKDEFKPTLVKESDIASDGHPGREWKLEFRGVISITRMYLVASRIYLIQVELSPPTQSQEAAAVKILDSFKLLTQEETEAQLAKRVSDATPALLPQEPVADRPSSDAKDDSLKGKVKTVLTATEDFSETSSVRGRKPSSMDHFNEQGNLTKSERYDYRGNLNGITVYGYLDGERVSSYKFIQHEYDPPPMMTPSVPGAVVAKSDPRYSTRITFKYDDNGRLKEKSRYRNNGELFSRSVYNYTANQMEILEYSKNGTLSQRYLYTLDENGNIIEYVGYEGNDNSVRRRHSYKNELDSKGNWIRRVASAWTTKDGKPEIDSTWVVYRTVTYYDASPTPPGAPVVSSTKVYYGAPLTSDGNGEVDKLLREERELFIAHKAPIVVSGGVLDGKAISKPRPIYPEPGKPHASGAVVVKILVGLDGKVIAAQIVSGHPLLHEAALKAARLARFSPTYLEGKPVKVSGVITYNFVLQ